MKFLKRFKTTSDFLNFKENEMTNNAYVSYVEEIGSSMLKPYIAPPSPAVAGDVVYWDGSQVKTTPLSKYNESMGAAVGVVVIPEGFAPDGKVRIVSLYGVDAKGDLSTSSESLPWGVVGIDTILKNYKKVPITDNNGSTSTGFIGNGYLPSDKFTGATSYVDSKAKYNYSSNLIPSPYLGDEPNPEYYNTIDSNNVLSDFNGLSNTQTLVGLGSDYQAANAAWKYNDGSSNLQWYLPAMGELGYIMPRFDEINNVITALGGLAVAGSNSFWSSSENTSGNAYYLYTKRGDVCYNGKSINNYVRPFAMLG